MGTSRRIDISGCYIVKDEADVIAASLEAIAPFVDETVVYDTGSSDDTVAIARAAGARVIVGYWDDDFGAARNRALEHCRGEWVFAVDADEVAQGDPREFRRQLQRNPTADVFAVAQVSPAWEGTETAVHARVGRVLRRSTARWTGALHEQIVGLRGQRLARGELRLELVHSGYTLLRSNEKDKGERNYRVARQELDTALASRHADLNRIRINFGRSAHLAGHLEEALDAYESVDLTTVTAPEVAVAAHGAVYAATELGRDEVALQWIERLEVLGEHPAVLRWLRVQVHVARHEWREALELMGRLTDTTDLRRMRFTAAAAEPLKVDAHFNLGEFDAAAEVVLEHLRAGRLDMSARAILHVFVRAGRDVREIAAALPAATAVPFLGQIHDVPYAVVAGFLETLWELDRARPAVLLSASAAWAELDVQQALVWSLRLRERGLREYCPLRRRFVAPGGALRARIVAGVALAEAGDDVREGLETLLAAVPDDEAADVVAAVAEISPRFAASLQAV